MFERTKRLTFVCLLMMIFGSVLLDQFSKKWAADAFMLWEDKLNLRAYQGKYQPLLTFSGQVSEENIQPSWYFKVGFNYVRNQGAAWGLFSKMDDRVRVPFFYAITIIATLVILLYWRQTPVSHRLVRFALALIFSGAIGNFTDRFSLGYVIDFIDVRWLIPLPFAINLSWDFFPSFLGFLNQNINISAWQYNFPNFNWADSMVTIGVSLIIIDMIFFERRRMLKEKK